MNRMTISRAAREAGVGVETIRFYERKGLIAACPARGALRACSILEALADAEGGGAGANGKGERSG